jgi:hypothetical protein
VELIQAGMTFCTGAITEIRHFHSSMATGGIVNPPELRMPGASAHYTAAPVGGLNNLIIDHFERCDGIFECQVLARVWKTPCFSRWCEYGFYLFFPKNGTSSTGIKPAKYKYLSASLCPICDKKPVRF